MNGLQCSPLPRPLPAARRRRQARTHFIPSAVAHQVLTVVGGIYEVTPDQLVSPGRQPVMVEARRIVCQLLYERGAGGSSIGRVIRRDHSTVLYSLHRLEAEMSRAEWSVLQDARARLRGPQAGQRGAVR